ncbi:MAG: sulfatase-like hydrolase/transferase, partial [Sulfurimonas sp.]|nr:sulfatase-like hydrolase/transferase [Sulfurimonas sp.]
YNLDMFFKSLLKNINLKETIIVYTSDHGQSILENNILSTHCSSTNPPLTQGIVPLFIVHDKDDVQYKSLQKNCFSHFNIFPTLLLWAGYNKDNISGKTILDNNCSTNYFFSGSIFGRTSLNKNFVKVDDYE